MALIDKSIANTKVDSWQNGLDCQNVLCSDQLASGLCRLSLCDVNS